MTDETPLSEFSSVTRRYGRMTVRLFREHLELERRQRGGRSKMVASYNSLTTDRTEGEFYERNPNIGLACAFLCGLVAAGLMLLSGVEPPVARLVGVIAAPFGFAGARRSAISWVSFGRRDRAPSAYDATVVGRPGRDGRDPEFDDFVKQVAERIRSADRNEPRTESDL